MTWSRARDHLEAAGFNLSGALGVERYDALVPDAWRAARIAPAARSVVVVGHGGRALWPRFRAAREAALQRDPLDRYTLRVVEEAAARLGPAARVALYSQRREGQWVPLVALAREAGFGVPGRVGVLLHPGFGPWISMRALLYAPLELPEARPCEGFAPCDGCPAPCASACHGAAVGPAGLDARRCHDTRHTDARCALDCDARVACVLAPEHGYPVEQRAHHCRLPDRG